MSETSSWTVGDGSAVDFILGHITKKWEADEESLGQAVMATIAATYVESGMDVESAVDLAVDQVHNGVNISWDGNELGFDFEKTDLDPTE